MFSLRVVPGNTCSHCVCTCDCCQLQQNIVPAFATCTIDHVVFVQVEDLDSGDVLLVPAHSLRWLSPLPLSSRTDGIGACATGTAQALRGFLFLE